MAGESFSIPSFDFDPYFCFPLSPVMEDELPAGNCDVAKFQE